MKNKFVGLIGLLIFILGGCADLEKSEQSDAFKEFWNQKLPISRQSDLPIEKHLSQIDREIQLEGILAKGDCDVFEKLVSRSNAHILTVNSQGGLVSEGLCMAKVMQERDVHTIKVNGVCWSSCANYLFLAAKNKIILRGTVGFHGNGMALLSSRNLLGLISQPPKNLKLEGKNLADFRNYIGESARRGEMSDEELRLFKKTIVDYKLESSFFKGLNIKQDFFEQTQKLDKGEGDGKTYMFLLPSARYFSSQLGVEVIGDQDRQFVKMANLKSPVPLLLKE